VVQQPCRPGLLCACGCECTAATESASLHFLSTQPSQDNELLAMLSSRRTYAFPIACLSIVLFIYHDWMVFNIYIH
jgi:hypothetical protein